MRIQAVQGVTIGYFVHQFLYQQTTLIVKPGRIKLANCMTPNLDVSHLSYSQCQSSFIIHLSDCRAWSQLVIIIKLSRRPITITQLESLRGLW